MKNLTSAVLALLLTACSTTRKILDADWASGTETEAPRLAKLKHVKSISREYCMESWSGSYGLMDEVLAATHKEDGVDYVKNASFVMKGNNCISVEGEGYRVIR